MRVNVVILTQAFIACLALRLRVSLSNMARGFNYTNLKTILTICQHLKMGVHPTSETSCISNMPQAACDVQHSTGEMNRPMAHTRPAHSQSGRGQTAPKTALGGRGESRGRGSFINDFLIK
jgi:hypothetical protein